MMDLSLAEKFAMQAEAADQEKPAFAGSIEIDPISEKLGLERRMGREVAGYLHKIGWAECDFGRKPPILTLTPKGYEEIAKLKRPAWRRWVDRNWAIVVAVSGVVTPIVVYLLTKWLDNWLGL